VRGVEKSMGAANAIQHHPSGEVQQVTLLELVQALSEETRDDREVVAAVQHLLMSGRVRLIGNFRNTPVQDFL
jgi:hypothetical protein